MKSIYNWSLCSITPAVDDSVMNREMMTPFMLVPIFVATPQRSHQLVVAAIQTNGTPSEQILAERFLADFLKNNPDIEVSKSCKELLKAAVVQDNAAGTFSVSAIQHLSQEVHLLSVGLEPLECAKS